MARYGLVYMKPYLPIRQRVILYFMRKLGRFLTGCMVKGFYNHIYPIFKWLKLDKKLIANCVAPAEQSSQSYYLVSVYSKFYGHYFLIINING